MRGVPVDAPARGLTVHDLIDPPEPVIAAAIGDIITPRVVGGPPYGLLTSAALILDEQTRNSHWEGGIGWFEEPNPVLGFTGTFDGCDPETDLDIDAPSVTPGAFTPFGIWAGERCSTRSPAADTEARARRNLDRLSTKLVEHEFWAGTQAQDSGWDNHYLTEDPDDILSGDATGPVTALAELEVAIGNLIAGPAMIHVAPSLATLWFHHGLLRREGRLLLTALDTIVVPGSGYPGTADGNNPSAPAETSWAYATPLVEVRLGPTFPLSIQEISGQGVPNTAIGLVGRMAAATFDTLDGAAPIGVQVSLCSANQACPAP